MELAKPFVKRRLGWQCPDRQHRKGPLFLELLMIPLAKRQEAASVLSKAQKVVKQFSLEETLGLLKVMKDYPTY
jgi:hypothetical protein